MHFEFSTRQRELFDQFARIGREISARADEHDKTRRFDEAGWQQISESGLWRLPVPRALGGAGEAWTDCIAAIEGLATTAGDLGFLISLLGHIGSLRIILEEGSAEQKERWLEPLMRGEVAVTAMTEASGGSDLARMQLAAVADQDGWRLSGRKVHITNGPVASLGMIAGRIPALGAKKDITLFFVDLSSEGVGRGELEDNLGIRTSPTCDLIFDRVRLDKINIMGQPGDGLRILYRIIAFERALYGVIASGLIENMIETAMNRVETRKAFGRPIGDYQYVQGRISDMKTASIICRLLTYSGLEKLDARAKDSSIVCSVAKFMAGEKLLEAAEHLVQLHGHLGFMNNALSRQLRDAAGMRIAGGTSDIQKINIFNQLRAQRRAQQMAETPAQAAE